MTAFSSAAWNPSWGEAGLPCALAPDHGKMWTHGWGVGPSPGLTDGLWTNFFRHLHSLTWSLFRPTFLRGVRSSLPFFFFF